jgi:hypothetical protein
MSIVSCSLACSDSAGNPGAQVNCGVTNVKVNQELRITFATPIDPQTITNNSFQVTEIGTGKTPAAAFSLATNDPRTLVYRPQLTFDSTGNPIFGLNEGRSYQLKIPGQVLDPLGPYIRNTIGTPNSTRLLCTLIASGIADPKPGRPRVTVTIDRVTGYDPNGEPNAFEFNFPAQGATSVYRLTPVRMVFDDVMNPATLANPVSGISSFIRAFIDANGDLTDSNDRVRIGGTFSITIDQNALRTTVVFTPSGGLPSAGTDPLNLRKVVVELSPQIADIGGLLLLNAGTIAFTPEQIALPPIELNELFADDSNQDALRSGTPWGAGATSVGLGGGSGRLGELIVTPGQIIELDTDSEEFTGIPVDSFNPANVIDRPANLLVEDGIFEFSRLRVDSGGVLRFRGSNPARVYVRGEAVVSGLIDVSGTSGRLQASDRLAGGDQSPGGPGGGLGGRGGARPDGTAFQGSFNGTAIGGVPNPAAGPSNVLDASTYVFVNGAAGVGVPFPSTIDPAPTFRGGGSGALAWPQPTAANPGLHMPQIPDDVSGLPLDPFAFCTFGVPAASGGGGSHAIAGRPGQSLLAIVPSVPMPTAPLAPGGASLNVDALVRTLSPELGFLRGGGGGGGGGAHLQLTQTSGTVRVDCSIPVLGPTVTVISHVAHSSAAGGGGGGGLQLAAGRRIVQSGVIDASGGDGGSGTFPPRASAPSNLAQGGGGGAGGSILLQSQLIQVSGAPNRLDISGGTGGDGSGRPFFPITPARGGAGSPGLLRMETISPLVYANEQTKVAPTSAQLSATYGSAVTIEEIFTTATWAPVSSAPSGWSGAQSCWMRPTGSFFRLIFAADGAELGWDMRLRIAGQTDPQSYRGANDLFPAPLEQVFGADFGTAPVIVRFQGARAISTLSEPCAVPESGALTPIAAGSISDWVRHPSELTDFYGQEGLTPNMVRFVVLWDRSQAELAQIEGLEDLTIVAQPD